MQSILVRPTYLCLPVHVAFSRRIVDRFHGILRTRARNKRSDEDAKKCDWVSCIADIGAWVTWNDLVPSAACNCLVFPIRLEYRRATGIRCSCTRALLFVPLSAIDRSPPRWTMKNAAPAEPTIVNANCSEYVVFFTSTSEKYEKSWTTESIKVA